jgi:hypothetical protein
LGYDKNKTLGTDIWLFVDNLFNTKIHTSCSVPIGPGLIQGDFKVIDAFSLYGGMICPINSPED